MPLVPKRAFSLSPVYGGGNVYPWREWGSEEEDEERNGWKEKERDGEGKGEGKGGREEGREDEERDREGKRKRGKEKGREDLQRSQFTEWPRLLTRCGRSGLRSVAKSSYSGASLALICSNCTHSTVA